MLLFLHPAVFSAQADQLACDNKQFSGVLDFTVQRKKKMQSLAGWTGRLLHAALPSLRAARGRHGFMNSKTADHLWSSVVPPKKKSSGRGKRAVARKRIDLGRNVVVGEGVQGMLWPGLNTRPEGKMAQRGEEQQKEYLQHREEVIAKRKRLGIESTRGWSGARWGGVHLDPPEPVPGQDFSDFKCVLMEVRRVSHRNSKIGRVYGIRAMVAVGNGKGIVGIGGCVASDLVSAVRKARLKAFNRLQYIERYVSCLINSGMGNLFTIAGRKL